MSRYNADRVMSEKYHILPGEGGQSPPYSSAADRCQSAPTVCRQWQIGNSQRHGVRTCEPNAC